jgi:hypothetical protein
MEVWIVEGSAMSIQQLQMPTSAPATHRREGFGFRGLITAFLRSFSGFKESEAFSKLHV